MKIAILLLCHKNPDQINTLIQIMNHESIDFFIHVDKKSKIENSIKKSKHVHILEDDLRIDVGWASFSQIEATANLISCAVLHSNYDYYWLCSGQDFPIKPIKEIVRFFEENGPNINYLNLFKSKNFQGSKSNNYDKRNEIFYPHFLMGREKWKRYIRRMYVLITGGYNNTFRWARPKLDNIDFYFGSQWWCLNHDTVKWLLNYEHAHSIYIEYFKHCSTPDESYYHTLVMNSPYAYQRKDYLHFIDWREGASSPKILKMEDVVNLLSSNFLMARKFDQHEDIEIISYLENMNQNRGKNDV